MYHESGRASGIQPRNVLKFHSKSLILHPGVQFQCFSLWNILHLTLEMSDLTALDDYRKFVKDYEEMIDDAEKVIDQLNRKSRYWIRWSEVTVPRINSVYRVYDRWTESLTFRPVMRSHATNRFIISRSVNTSIYNREWMFRRLCYDKSWYKRKHPVEHGPRVQAFIKGQGQSFYIVSECSFLIYTWPLNATAPGVSVIIYFSRRDQNLSTQ